MSDRLDANCIIFDLDGTIIDSYPGIQAAFSAAYEKLYNCNCPYKIQSLVGPPINDIFAKVSGEKDLEKINTFVKYFKESYDSINYKQCNLYEGMTEVFETLTKNKIALYIATNKRLIPTELILKELHIANFFKSVYCIDSTQGNYNNKINMITTLLENEKIDAVNTLLIGDTFHDQIAAQENKVKFIYAKYGFGDLNDCKYTITHPLNILNYIN